MRIAIGCDHRGFDLKQNVIRLLSEGGYSFQDFGCFDTASVDYPDIAKVVAEAVARGEFDRGILVCDTGIGMCIAANKVKGIRAAQCYDSFCAMRARMHNDANVICLGAGVEKGNITEIINTFLKTDFEGGRHQRRLDKIHEMEK